MHPHNLTRHGSTARSSPIPAHTWQCTWYYRTPRSSDSHKQPQYFARIIVRRQSGTLQVITPARRIHTNKTMAERARSPDRKELNHRAHVWRGTMQSKLRWAVTTTQPLPTSDTSYPQSKNSQARIWSSTR